MAFYAVGLVGLNFLYMFPWLDPDHKTHAMHSGGGVCLPEQIDLEKMNLTSDSKFLFRLCLDPY